MNPKSLVHTPEFPESMKDIIFNLLEDAVISNHGEDTWDQLLTATALDGNVHLNFLPTSKQLQLGPSVERHVPMNQAFFDWCFLCSPDQYRMRT